MVRDAAIPVQGDRLMLQLSCLSRGARRSCVLAALALLSAAPWQPLAAQYFGRQKVQYETFDFRVMRTEHFDIHFYPEAQQAIHDAARMSERWYARLGSILRHDLGRQPLIYYADHPDFQQTNVIGGLIDQSTGGVTEGLRNRVILPLTSTYASTDHVVGHELVHAFQYDIAQQRGAGGLQGMAQLPLWLIEGMAEYLSIGGEDAHTAMWLRDAALRDDLPTLRQLTRDPRYFPYRYGQALWAYVGGRWGDDVIPTVYRAAVQLGFEQALRTVLGVSSDTLSRQWIEAIRAAYDPVIAGRARPSDQGRLVIGDPDEIGDMSISPVISPDGRHVAFYGRRELFTVDLYLADARTGEVIRELASPQTDQHFDAISFLYSAGTWSPDGSRFAFVAFADGDNRIQILNVESGRIEQSIGTPGVGAITDPTWSPDGARIAFSGMSGGISDLYVIELGTQQMRRLTNDRHADLQPVWSPDGRTLAFASDRGPETSFERLTYSSMRLSLLDVASGAVRVLDGFPDAKHINPQFTADGRDLYFISDRGGFPDVYRMALETGDLFQVTRLATGVSGITALSPAISVGRDGQLLYSAFFNSGQQIYALDASQARGTPVSGAPDVDAAVLPPPTPLRRSTVETYLADATIGLPPPGAEFEIVPYRSSLALDYVGGPSFGAGVNEFGAAFGGGIAFLFGDMLGDRNLTATLQASGTVKDFGGQLAYTNMRRRINYGAGIAHVPYLSGRTGIRPTTFEGFAADEYFTVFQRVYFDEAAVYAQYPLSTTRRVEGQLGFTRLTYDYDVDRMIVVGNTIVDRQQESIDAPDPVHYAQASAAFVGDNSFSAFVGPISGSRYRLEASPTLGTVQFTSVLADWRKYFLLQPVTFAIRGFHFARYGRDAESDRITPLYVGYESLVRGYAVESFDFSECTQVSDPEACPEFDRLVGSRIAVASAELRIPLFGTEQYGIIDFSFLPTEIAPFVDAGVAWTSDETPDFRFDRGSTPDRIPVVSAGVSARMNVLGYLIFEAYWAYPFQRPERGGHFGFAIQPGW